MSEAYRQQPSDQSHLRTEGAIESGIAHSAFVAKMGRAESEVRRILDPDDGTKLDQLEEAAVGLDGRLVVAFEAV